MSERDGASHADALRSNYLLKLKPTHLHLVNGVIDLAIFVRQLHNLLRVGLAAGKQGLNLRLAGVEPGQLGVDLLELFLLGV